MASVDENPDTKMMEMLEKEEENKLKAKYPRLQRPGPQFLQKRLQKGQKFFDSGDYNMAKAAAAKGTTGKSRLSDLKMSQGPPLPPSDGPAPPNPTDDLPIPTPDCLATRKASIHVPSKLVSGGP